MIEKLRAEITTNSSGDATVYLTPGVNSRPNGLLLVLIYTPGSIVTGADLTITGESSGIPILTITNAGTTLKHWYPRALLNAVADGTAASAGSEVIPICNERIQVVVAQGGDTKTGTIEALLLTDSPY